MNKSFLTLGVLLMTAGATMTARAQLVTNFNFDDQAIGQTPITTAPGTDPQPQQHIYSIGGFPDIGPYSGTVTIQNAGTMSKAAVMTTTQGGIGSNFIDTQFLTSGQQISVDFDLDVVNVPTTGLPQSATNIPNGQAFVVQAFATSGGGSDRVFRFAVSPTSATTGIFGLRDNTVGDIIPFGTYTEGETHHISIVANYSTSTVSAYLDGNPAVLAQPFVNVGATGLGELFIFQNGVEGLTNSVGIDNIVTAVPEPSIVGLSVAAGAMLLGRRSRKASR